MFPSVGSTVTNVTTTKTGTAARVDFSDGSSLYVKYEAIILNPGSQTIIRSTKPIVHENKVLKSRVEKHFANLPKKTVPVTRTSVKLQSRIQEHSLMDNGRVSDEALLKAKLRTESRVDRLAKKWDSEHPSGEAGIAAMNGK
jgi:hypothetical protein